MNKKLKIAMIFSYDPSQAGGVQEHVRMLSNNLSKLGHKVDIYGPEKNIHRFYNYHEIAKSVTIPIPNGSWANITIEKNDLKKEIIKIRKLHYDIIHIHDPYVPFVGWEIMKINEVKKVATFHSAWEKKSIISIVNPFLTLFQNTFSSNFSGAIFVSKIVEKRWQELSGKNTHKTIIHNGVEKIFYPIKKSRENLLSLLFLGRLVEKKGPKLLLNAFCKILKKFPNTKLIFIGKGIIQKSLENIVKNKKIINNVTFKGEIIGSRRVKYYQQADIFCAPYSDEAFGMTILEAMATGTPIVGFNNSAFKEILKGYPKDLLVKSRDVGQLARAIEKLIVDKEKRQKISEWLVKESKKYSWEKIARETEEFYYKILNSQS
jgi:phosphatidyl-myo-inositol alpha-mannosyltransferase